MNDLHNCLLSCGLDDLKAYGNAFTWHNNNEVAFISRKLDRVVVNDKWMASFQYSYAHFMSPIVSDHSSMTLCMGKEAVKGKTFKFFNHWAHFPEFLPLVFHFWKIPVRGSAMFQVCHKLKKLKGELRKMQEK